MIHRTNREEAETTINYNRHHGVAEMSTADPVVMRRWQRAGWPVVVLGAYRDGKPRTWSTAVPWRRAVRFAPVRERPARAA